MGRASRPNSALDTTRAPLVASAPFMRAKVIVMPKKSILDPQGVAVRDAIRHHGVPGAKTARVGKMIELELEDGTTEAQLHEVCRDLLSNPVVEDYEVAIES